MAGAVDVEHLRAIQAIIARLAGNVFTIKGWSITLSGGLIAASTELGGRSTLAVAIIVSLAFGVLDAMYLAWERGFRGLYGRARLGLVDPHDLTPDRTSWITAARSPSVWIIHGLPMMLAAAMLLG